MTGKGVILVVDDTSLIREVLSEILLAEGFEVRSTDSGELALDSVAAGPPELILLDIRMPGMDGMEVLRQLKARQNSRDIPIILISGAAEIKERVEGLKLGAVDFITKPFQSEELLARVRTHLLLGNVLSQLRSEIAERKKAEKIAWESEHQLMETLESITDAFFSLDESLRVTYYNEAAVKLLRLGRDEVIGRRLFDAFPEARGSVFEENYTRAVKEKIPLAFETYFSRPPLENWYGVRVYPKAEGISVYFQVITERKRAEAEREELINELKEALANVKQLSGMLPICGSCKKIRDDKGYWSGVESYITAHAGVLFSHGICPECEKKTYEDIEKLKKDAGR